VLDTIARTLDYPGFTQFSHDEKQYEVEQLLRRQKVLLIIDNAETITDGALFSWLLRLPEPSKAIITTREYQRAYRRGGWPVELRGMSEAEARTLLQQRLERLRISHLVHDPAQLEPVLVATGGNPKAIAMVAGLLKYERRPLQQIVDDLYAARGDLFDDLFSRAWALLDEVGKRIVMVMTFFPDSASSDALSTIADVTGFDFDRAVEWLSDLSLLDVQQADVMSQPRYVLHPLVRAFAGSQLLQEPVFEADSRERWVNYFRACGRRWEQHGWDSPSQLEAVSLEIMTIQAIIDYCWKTRQFSTFTEMVLHSCPFWGIRGYYDTRNQYIEWALQIARQRGDASAQIQFLSMKVRSLCYQDDVESATAACHELNTVLAALPEPDIHLRLSANYAKQQIYRLLEDWESLWNVLNDTFVLDSSLSRRHTILTQYVHADLLYATGEHRAAENLLRTAIHESTEKNLLRAPIRGWLLMARIALQRNDIDAAEQNLEQAYDRAVAIQHRRFIAETLQVKAQYYLSKQEFINARCVLTEAVALFERLGILRPLAEAREELARLEAQMATTPDQ
jgi:hypothetical protein